VSYEGNVIPMGLIVFDFDGTLVDSLGCITKSFKNTASQLGLQVPTDENIMLGIGLSCEQQIKRIYANDMTKNVQEKFIYTFRENFNKYAFKNKEFRIFPNVESIINRLKNEGYILAIATAGGRLYLDQALKVLNWEHIFSYTACGDEFPSKPDPEMLMSLDKKCNYKCDKYMIGDSIIDIKMGKQAGFNCIGVLSGVSTRRDFEQIGDFPIIDSLSSLHMYLN
jgi:phosphoglycolate phosphatase